MALSPRARVALLAATVLLALAALVWYLSKSSPVPFTPITPPVATSRTKSDSTRGRCARFGRKLSLSSARSATA